MDGSSFRELSEWMGGIVGCIGIALLHRAGELQEHVDPFDPAHAAGQTLCRPGVRQQFSGRFCGRGEEEGSRLTT